MLGGGRLEREVVAIWQLGSKGWESDMIFIFYFYWETDIVRYG